MFFRQYRSNSVKGLTVTIESLRLVQSLMGSHSCCNWRENHQTLSTRPRRSKIPVGVRRLGLRYGRHRLTPLAQLLEPPRAQWLPRYQRERLTPAVGCPSANSVSCLEKGCREKTVLLHQNPKLLLVIQCLN